MIGRTVLGRTASALLLIGMLAARPAAQLPLEPLKDSGQGVTAAYEGWFRNPDGTFTLLIGYLNRNQKQALDIPIGPANRIEPGGPDQGQPTHFLPRRQWGVFTVNVPANFGERTVTWTLEANGKTTVGADGPESALRGRAVQGRREQQHAARVAFRTGRLAVPGAAAAHCRDARHDAASTGDADALRDRRRHRHARSSRGRVAGERDVEHVPRTGRRHVQPTSSRPLDKSTGKATTTATFSAPGEYVLRLQANDVSGEGGGGFQCCWTNVHVKVVVKER